MRSILSCLLALVLTAAATQALAGKRLDKVVEGFWTAYAYENDDGAFSHCSVETRFKDGMTLGLRAYDGGFNLHLENDDWQMDTDGRSAVEVVIAGAYDRFTSMTVVSNRELRAGFGFDKAFWKAFRAGNTMRLTLADGRAWSIDLKGTSTTAGAVESCYRRHFAKRASALFD
ncbi:hypothetical protein L2U69_09885 [Zavarzinia compransoris]|uniref:hypothetical protein n=1 Tax=Zavarzinia marina TaxID=2911065 RepID=UPI001F3DAA8E|nr:hypothetical protein [Zavarzinia marina]MCF4165953.1 hypothetical protein [Zavarzinia marina]